MSTSSWWNDPMHLEEHADDGKHGQSAVGQPELRWRRENGIVQTLNRIALKLEEHIKIILVRSCCCVCLSLSIGWCCMRSTSQMLSLSTLQKGRGCVSKTTCSKVCFQNMENGRVTIYECSRPVCSKERKQIPIKLRRSCGNVWLSIPARMLRMCQESGRMLDVMFSPLPHLMFSIFLGMLKLRPPQVSHVSMSNNQWTNRLIDLKNKFMMNDDTLWYNVTTHLSVCLSIGTYRSSHRSLHLFHLSTLSTNPWIYLSIPICLSIIVYLSFYPSNHRRH